MCRAHGGAAPQVRQAADERAAWAAELRAHVAARARYDREWTAWQAHRIAVTSELMGVPVDEVTPVLIGACRGWFGVPAGEDTGPAWPPRLDRRYGPRGQRSDI